MPNEEQAPEGAAANRQAYGDSGDSGQRASREPATEREAQPSAFPHPPWTVGVVLALGVVSLLFGILVRPIFLAIGSPFIIVLLLWLYVRMFARGDLS